MGYVARNQTYFLRVFLGITYAELPVNGGSAFFIAFNFTNFV